MMRTSGRPLHVLLEQESARDEWVAQMRAEGLPLFTQELVMEVNAEFQLSEYNLFDSLPGWVNPLVGSIEERTLKLKDPDIRDEMKRDADARQLLRTDWSRVTVLETMHERNYKYDGSTIAEIAAAQGKHPVDAFLDLALDEGLETVFAPPRRPPASRREHPEPLRSRLRVRRRRPHPIPHHEHLACRVPDLLDQGQTDHEPGTGPLQDERSSRWFADFKDRGTLRVGDWADVMVYNLDELGFQHEKMIYAHDFPGGERRIIQKPTGLRYTLVNGAVTFEGNDCTAPFRVSSSAAVTWYPDPTLIRSWTYDHNETAAGLRTERRISEHAIRRDRLKAYSTRRGRQGDWKGQLRRRLPEDLAVAR